jgi:hypothetical protein
MRTRALLGGAVLAVASLVGGPPSAEAHNCIGITPFPDPLNCGADVGAPGHMCTTQDILVGTLVVCRTS